MARGKIITDPRQWLLRQLNKAQADYQGSCSSAQRYHLQDKIDMLETCLSALDSYRWAREYKEKAFQYEQCLEKFKEATGLTVMEFIKLKEKEQAR